jgi:enoyl-[acyl-carrier protein] reductase/trans-2-enoyl-CoA reductase (NAD+)
MNQANFKELGDYEGFKSDFLQLNGFDYDNIDYLAKTDITGLKKLVP